MKKGPLLLVSLFCAVAGSASAITPDSFTFDDALLGEAVFADDGGNYANQNWLNVQPENPGVEGSLTGANFDTGIANISDTVYGISYNTGILNTPGEDLGVVVARFSADNIAMSVSVDGISYSPTLQIAAETAVQTSATRDFLLQHERPLLGHVVRPFARFERLRRGRGPVDQGGPHHRRRRFG